MYPKPGKKGEPLINISIPNYKFGHTDSTAKAGGVAIYISSKFDFELDCERKMHIKGCDDLWINFMQKEKASKKLTIGAIYRHPNPSSNSIETFSEALSNTIHKIINRKRTFSVLGDMNIDISANKRTQAASIYIDHLASCGSVPIITKPTRVTDKTSTTIDHITVLPKMQRTLYNQAYFAATKTFRSFGPFLQCNWLQLCSTSRTNYVIRDISNFNAKLYCNELNSAITSFLLNGNELTEANFDNHFDAFTFLIQRLINKHAPLKKLSRKQKN